MPTTPFRFRPCSGVRIGLRARRWPPLARTATGPNEPKKHSSMLFGHNTNSDWRRNSSWAVFLARMPELNGAVVAC